MSKLSNLIFHNEDTYITSSYGYRKVISTSKGNTSSFHNGVDYGTNGRKLPQYSIDEGVIISCGTDWAYGGAKYVWVKYPRLGVKMLHYHLDSIKVKKNQVVNTNTIIGYTGKTGKATGVHLHLGLKLLSGDGYIDPEAWFEKNYKEPEKDSSNKIEDFLPKRGYFKDGDVSENVGKIAAFMREVFPKYTSKKALGNTYGKYLKKAITQFQENTGLVPDGLTGPITVKKFTEFGFKF